jgi:hypothetical protein
VVVGGVCKCEKILEDPVLEQDRSFVCCSWALCAAVKKAVKKEVEGVFVLRR